MKGTVTGSNNNKQDKVLPESDGSFIGREVSTGNPVEPKVSHKIGNGDLGRSHTSCHGDSFHSDKIRQYSPENKVRQIPEHERSDTDSTIKENSGEYQNRKNRLTFMNYHHRPGQITASSVGVKLVPDCFSAVSSQMEVNRGCLGEVIQNANSILGRGGENISDIFDIFYNTEAGSAICQSNVFSVNKKTALEFITLFEKGITQEFENNKGEKIYADRIRAASEIHEFVNSLSEEDVDCAALLRLSIQLLLRCRKPEVLGRECSGSSAVFSIFTSILSENPHRGVKIVLKVMADNFVHLRDDRPDVKHVLGTRNFSLKNEPLADQIIAGLFFSPDQEGSSTLKHLKIVDDIGIKFKRIKPGESRKKIIRSLATVGKKYPMVGAVKAAYAEFLAEYVNKTDRVGRVNEIPGDIEIKKEILAGSQGLISVLIEDFKLLNRGSKLCIECKFTLRGRKYNISLPKSDFVKIFDINEFTLFLTNHNVKDVSRRFTSVDLNNPEKEGISEAVVYDLVDKVTAEKRSASSISDRNSVENFAEGTQQPGRLHKVHDSPVSVRNEDEFPNINSLSRSDENISKVGSSEKTTKLNDTLANAATLTQQPSKINGSFPKNEKLSSGNQSKLTDNNAEETFLAGIKDPALMRQELISSGPLGEGIEIFTKFHGGEAMHNFFNSYRGFDVFKGDDFIVNRRSVLEFIYLFEKAVRQESPPHKYQKLMLVVIERARKFVESLKDSNPNRDGLLRNSLRALFVSPTSESLPSDNQPKLNNNNAEDTTFRAGKKDTTLMRQELISSGRLGMGIEILRNSHGSAALDNLFNSHEAVELFRSNNYTVNKRSAIELIDLFDKAARQERKWNKKQQERLVAIKEIRAFVKSLNDSDPDLNMLLRISIQMLGRCREPRMVAQNEIRQCGVFGIVTQLWRVDPLDATRLLLKIINDGIPKEAIYTFMKDSLADKLLISRYRPLSQLGNKMDDLANISKSLGFRIKKFDRHASLPKILEALKNNKKCGVIAVIKSNFTDYLSDMNYYKGRKMGKDPIAVRSRKVAKCPDSKSTHAVLLEDISVYRDSGQELIEFKLSSWGVGERIVLTASQFAAYFIPDWCQILISHSANN